MTTYAPGTFCWADLSTTDPKAATAFYEGLFSWTHYVNSSDHGDYTLLQKDGKDIGGLYQQMPEQAEAGVPPHWLSYVCVENTHASAAKAKELGGSVIMEPMDVMDHGLMAVIVDPSGAPFAIWQPKAHSGAGFFGDPGSYCWFELMTRDAAACKAFYSGLFGWTPVDQQMKDPSGKDIHYTMMMMGEMPAAGMMEMGEEFPAEVPPHWMLYFAVEDCEAGAKYIQDNGGQLHVPPTDIPGIGRFAAAMDPQGGAFCIIKLLPQEGC
ncbi:MAG: VOC family protein [Planctomycetota bacterium]|nr:MAG: VOC family protein [Planctomycetota bacterium]